MRVATWKLAALMGVVPTASCVQKIEPPAQGPSLGDAGPVVDMDASLMPEDADMPDAMGGRKDGGGEQVGGLNCTTYCTEIMASCEGAFAQYDSMAQCLNACADMEPGNDNDATGDTLGCRIYHVRRGVMLGQLDVHCNHAGLSGGEVCGVRCESLCRGTTTLCVESNGVDNDSYDSYDDCMSICQPDAEGQGGYEVDTVERPATGDTVQCRIYHLGNAYKYYAGPEQSDEQLNIHCEHTRQFGGPCGGP